MSDMRQITTKHKREDAATLRRAVEMLDDGKQPIEVLALLYLALHIAERIEHAFRAGKVVALRPGHTDGPEVA